MPLPLSLGGFQARYAAGQDQLEWAARDEGPRGWFWLERSPDGQDFQKITQFHTAGNPGKYTFCEQWPSHSRALYYRLQMVDENGKVASPLRYLSHRGDQELLLGQVVPQDGFLEVELASPIRQPLRLQLLSPEGRVVNRESLTILVGLSTQRLDIPKGQCPPLVEILSPDTAPLRKMVMR